MKYLIIGAGGVGGAIAGYMAMGGLDVTVIARGEHLEAIKENGLTLETTGRGTFSLDVSACTMEEYSDNPDVIFVCVKGYSLDSVVPFVKRVAKAETVVIPVLNIYGTGGVLAEELPGITVTDGCIYVASEIKMPGVIWMNGSIFRIVYGMRDRRNDLPVLHEVKKDLDFCGIEGVLSDNVQRDALKKFAYVSPAATCGVYYNASAGDMQKPGEIRDTFAALIHEIDLLAGKMGIDFGIDIVATNLGILDNLAPTASTSMQRDIAAGRDSEIDGLCYGVVRMGEQYGVELPVFTRIAEELKERL